MPAGPQPSPSGSATNFASIQNDFDAQRKKNIILGSAIAGVVIVLAAFAGFRAFANLGARGGAPNPALNARGNTPRQVLQANSKLPPPVLNKGDEQKKPVTMPADIYEWLKHLERCEAMKIEITGDQQAEMMTFMTKLNTLGAGIGLMDPYDQSGDAEGDQGPDTYTKGKILDMRPRWMELITFFNSKKPPAECQPLANDFNQAIGEIPGMAGDIADVLNSVASNPQAALEMLQKSRNKSNGSIDRYFARADEKLTRICKKYETNKWFNIKTDIGGGMLSSFGGLGAGALGGQGLTSGAGIPGGIGLGGGGQ
jgi:hypothetical protein